MLKGMYSKLPQSIIIGKEKIFINTDFRIFIEYEKEILEGNTKQATINVLESFVPVFFNKERSKEEIDELIDKFLWFYSCGKGIDFNNNRKSNDKIVDYEYDSDLIWGSYWQFARIDLTRDYVHWWKFKAIWNSLPSDYEFNKIKGYRAYNGKDKDMLELKEAYKLPLTEGDKIKKEKYDKIYEMFK